MTRVEKLEQDIMGLSLAELNALRDWFQVHMGDAWDRQIEVDAKAGKLDSLAKAALEEHKAGSTRPL